PYYGGTGNEWGYGLSANDSGYVYMAGQTTSSSGISSGCFQNTYGGGQNDAFLVKFSSNCLPLAVSENENSDLITIYPNPSADIFNIECNKEIKMLIVNNIVGEEIYKSSNSLNVIDLSLFSQGIYILTIKTAKGAAVKKIIK